MTNQKSLIDLTTKIQDIATQIQIGHFKEVDKAVVQNNQLRAQIQALTIDKDKAEKCAKLLHKKLDENEQIIKQLKQQVQLLQAKLRKNGSDGDGGHVAEKTLELDVRHIADKRSSGDEYGLE